MPSGHARRLFATLAAKIALGVIFSVCALAIGAVADPHRYPRPSSLFFPEVKAPPEPPKPPEPQPDPTYSVTLDLGAETASESEIDLGSDRLVSWRLEPVVKPAPRSSRGERGPLAFGVIGNCSGLLGGNMPRYIQPAKLLERFSQDDLVAFMTVADGARRLLDWTLRDEAIKKAPTDYSAGGIGYTPDTSVDPIINLFRETPVRGKQRVAVLLGDLIGNNEDVHVLRCAEALAGEGVRVFVVKYGDAPVNPRVEEVCRSTGGELIQAESMEALGDGLRRVHEFVGGATRTNRLHLRFQSSRGYREGEEVTIRVNGKEFSGKVE